MDNQTPIDNERSGLEIAVLAIAGRFPGADDIDRFWSNLRCGVESLTFLSDAQSAEAGIERELLHHPDFVKAAGGVLEGKDTFDAPLFGFTPLEAQVADPQVRKLLECAWTVLERAGIDSSSYEGLIGLYAGASANFHWEALTHLSGLRRELGEFAASQLTGREFCATLVSYHLGLKGPAVTVGTACSTSLVAVHLASQALLNGECHLALAGGVSIHGFQSAGYLFQQGAINSNDGHCRAFSDDASGTVAGEGVGLAALKPLEDAEAAGDPIIAVIKGTAVNNDGRRKGAYSAPSIEGQAEVIRAALDVAGVAPETIGFVEAHGTGTVLGDPIEIEALNQAFAGCPVNSCAVGSVKTNIGHLDAAAGIAGFIKAILSVSHREIPPSLHFARPNPRIPFSSGPFYVNHTLSPWQSSIPARAGVSSFGIGGTNAHVIVEEYNPPATGIPTTNPASADRYHLLPLSAHTDAALRQTRENLARHFKENPELPLPYAAFTLQTGRRHLRVRKMVVCAGMEDAVDSLANDDSPYRAAGSEAPPVVFMFPGQGAQHTGMGRGLYQNEPVFRREMECCLGILRGEGVDLEHFIYREDGDDSDPSAINDTTVAQPLLFAVEYSLARLLISWGVEPYAMTGHSLGEFTAACLAGVFSLDDALRLVVLRGRLMKTMPDGAMLGISAKDEEVLELLVDENYLSLAAVNSPHNVVVSGPLEAVAGFEGLLVKREIPHRRLHTSHAFHSAMMEPIVEEFVRQVASIPLMPPRIPYISNVTGHWITKEDAMDPAYWGRHLRQTVRFRQGVELLLQRPAVVFLEVGPGETLSRFVTQQSSLAPERTVISTMPHPREEVPHHKRLLQAVGRLWMEGISVDWRRFQATEHRRRVLLPTYPFGKNRYWIGLDTPLSSFWNPGEAASLKWNLTSDQPEETAPGSQISAFKPPETETQQALIAIWREFFGSRRVGIDDDFFRLGGDSLKATALIAKIHREMAAPVPLQALFDNPTVESLADYVDTRCQIDRIESMPEAEQKDYYPLSPAQERLFVLHRWNRESTAYNLPAAIFLEGNLDEGRLEAVFAALIRRHESLRTGFILVDGQPAQRILPDAQLRLEYFSSSESEAGVVIRSFIRPFDLASPPLLRVGVATIGARRHVLLADMHHIISDGASIAVLQQEFIALYRGDTLPPLNRQYKDFAAWLRRMTDKGDIQQQRRYWIDRFSGEIPVIELPIDFPRPAQQRFSGRTLEFAVAGAETEALLAIANAHKSTLYMTVLALVHILLSKISGQEDIVVGSPASGRRHPDAAPLIGMFVNTLALRSQPRGSLAFTHFLEQIRQLTIGAFANQDYPFDELVQNVSVRRDVSRNPLFDVMVSWQRPDALDEDLPELTARPFRWEKESVLFDLVIQAVQLQDHIHLNVSYCTALFREETILRFVSYLQTIIAAVTRRPEIRLDDIDIIPIQDKETILATFNDTQTEFPGDSTLHDLFCLRAAVQPGAVAVVASDRHISYYELERRSRSVAAALRRDGARPGEIVLLLLERGIEMVVGMLGVQMGGCAYLPLGIDEPREKIRYIATDSSARFLVADRERDGDAELPGIERMNIADPKWYQTDPGFFESEASFLSPAYVIYTSGSTGKPKGVVVLHRGAVNVVCWYKNVCNLKPGDRMLLMSTYTFDLSVVNVYGCILAGAAVHIEVKDLILNIPAFRRYISGQRITVIDFVPTVLEQLLEKGNRLESLRLVISSAERLDDQLKDRLLQKGYLLYNHYGPTEISVLAAQQVCSEAAVTLGKPIANTRCYVISANGKLQPIGVWGELCIGGVGVTPGYLNRPELTARQFVPDPFSQAAIMYKTGDRARFLGDGSIEFSGRLDQQLKLRGFRIEPGEIESRLQALPGIEHAAVIMTKDGNDEPCLAAYVTTTNDAAFDAGFVKQELAHHLPPHMVPPHIIKIDHIPRTSSGKIDRKSLASLPLAEAAQEHIIAPETDGERAIAAIWNRVLGTKDVSVLRNFFDAGGNSLKVIQVHQALILTFGRDVPVPALFEHVTIRALARYLELPANTGDSSAPPARTDAIHEGRARLGRRLDRKGGSNG